MIIPSLIEKFSFVIAVARLTEQRVGTPIIIGASLDAVLAVLFIICWVSLRNVDRIEL